MSAASACTATTDAALMTPGSPLAGREALILGGGVAGLAVALALAQGGGAVEVLEHAPAITEVGAGVQISPNGARVLRALGLDPAAIGDLARAVILHDHRARPVTRMALPPAPGFYLTHRADLIAALERAARAAGVTLHLLQQIAEAQLTPGGVDLRMATGATRAAPLVLGADGLHSRVRAALNGAAVPFFTGQVAWRATIPGDAADPVVQVFMGPGRHLVSYPLRGGALRNLVAVEERRTWAEESWSATDDPANLRAAFAGFGGPVPGWLARVQTAHLWGLFRHPVAPAWTDGQGRAAILGDAAHPTLPFLAQGANLALEDAWELAAHLAAIPDPAAALSAWAIRRRPRAEAVIAAANRNARAYHLRAPLAPLAHAVLRLGGALAPGAALGRFAWVHGYDATAPLRPGPIGG
jgi:salicylate hydroxylase